MAGVAEGTQGALVLRPSWVSTCSIAGGVPAIVALLASLMGAGMSAPIVFIGLFSAVSIVFDRRRALELSPTAAIRGGPLLGATIERADVSSVRRAPWWRGGLTLVGRRGSLWVPVGDRPLGLVSSARVQVVQDWIDDSPGPPELSRACGGPS